MSACQLIFEKSNQSMESWNNLEKSIQYSSCVYMELQKCKNDAMKTELRIETADQGGKPFGASVFRRLKEISTRIVMKRKESRGIWNSRESCPERDDCKKPEPVDSDDNNKTVLKIHRERLLKIYAMNRKRLRMKIWEDTIYGKFN